jgi:putative transcriptional regulator
VEREFVPGRYCYQYHTLQGNCLSGRSFDQWEREIANIVARRGGPMPSQEPEIKKQIRRLRFQHGEMTQDQLAKQASVTRHTIRALEADKYFPSLLLAFLISRVFGAPVEQVFEYRAPELNL